MTPSPGSGPERRFAAVRGHVCSWGQTGLVADRLETSRMTHNGARQWTGCCDARICIESLAILCANLIGFCATPISPDRSTRRANDRPPVLQVQDTLPLPAAQIAIDVLPRSARHFREFVLRQRQFHRSPALPHARRYARVSKEATPIFWQASTYSIDIID